MGEREKGKEAGLLTQYKPNGSTRKLVFIAIKLIILGPTLKYKAAIATAERANLGRNVLRRLIMQFLRNFFLTGLRVANVISILGIFVRLIWTLKTFIKT